MDIKVKVVLLSVIVLIGSFYLLWVIVVIKYIKIVKFVVVVFKVGDKVVIVEWVYYLL